MGRKGEREGEVVSRGVNKCEERSASVGYSVQLGFVVVCATLGNSGRGLGV